MSPPLLSCEVDYRTSWESQNTRDNVWNKLPSALCQKAAKWKSFKIIIFPTTSLMRNMSKIKLKMCSLAVEKGCLTGLLKPMNLIISFTATVQVSREICVFGRLKGNPAGWEGTPSASRTMQSTRQAKPKILLCVENTTNLGPVFSLQIGEKNWQGHQQMWASFNQLMALSSGL